LSYSSGVVHLKEIQDESPPIEAHYIRHIIFMTELECSLHEEDESESRPEDVDGVRIVICMTREGSQRLLQAQYLQSDMAFKHVVGFHEFELATIDRISRVILINLQNQRGIAVKRRKTRKFPIG
jgi:hypothetical protein